ncbi:MAG: PEP-CTERM sorting domain-containing protein [Gemmatimonadales bacterium]|nr:PEP-CTERM sorting domain-containing protein [Gemmatimonadales bacterium]
MHSTVRGAVMPLLGLALALPALATAQQTWSVEGFGYSPALSTFLFDIDGAGKDIRNTNGTGVVTRRDPAGPFVEGRYSDPEAHEARASVRRYLGDYRDRPIYGLPGDLHSAQLGVGVENSRAGMSGSTDSYVQFQDYLTITAWGGSDQRIGAYFLGSFTGESFSMYRSTAKMSFWVENITQGWVSGSNDAVLVQDGGDGADVDMICGRSLGFDLRCAVDPINLSLARGNWRSQIWTSLDGRTFQGDVLRVFMRMAVSVPPFIRAGANLFQTGGMLIRGDGIQVSSASGTWGVVQAPTTVVPEPSTYALLGGGLLLLGIASRRR